MYRAQVHEGDLKNALDDVDDEVCKELCRVLQQSGSIITKRGNVGTILHVAVRKIDVLLMLSLLKGMMLLDDFTWIKMRDADGKNFLELAMRLGRGEILRYSAELLGPDAIKSLLSTP